MSLEDSWEGLRASGEGPGASWEGWKPGGRPRGGTDGNNKNKNKNKNKKMEKISPCGDAIGHRPLRGRCPKRIEGACSSSEGL